MGGEESISGSRGKHRARHYPLRHFPSFPLNCFFFLILCRPVTPAVPGQRSILVSVCLSLWSLRKPFSRRRVVLRDHYDSLKAYSQGGRV